MASIRDLLTRAAGGREQARIVLVLASVLGLSGADSASISATAGNLEHVFHVGNTQIGFLVSVVAVVGGILTVPAGVLTDRTKRTRLLAVSVLGWSVATALSGAAPTYRWLIGARAALGLVSATAGPVVASLTGDFFPADERARIYGLIVGGELAGTGLGFVVSGEIAAATSWRYALWWLVVPSLAVAWAVHRLPEPARGGRAHRAQRAQATPGEDLAEEAVRRSHVEPQQELVLHSDPANYSTWWAVRYVLRVRTNVIIIVASALGYFYFAGLRTFAVIYVTRHYGLSKSVADVLLLVVGAGAVAGVFAGGRAADRLLRRGVANARVVVPAVCLLALGPVLAPAIAVSVAFIAVPLLTFGAFLLGAPNPPLDAARLDIMHPRLWGRAEGVRTVLRTFGEAAAPTIFGYVSQYAFGGHSTSAGSATQSATSGAGLEYTFLVLLVLVEVAGLLALLGTRTYPRDVATARESVTQTERTDQEKPHNRLPNEGNRDHAA